MMKRKFYALFLAGAMMLSLAACGTNAAGPSGNGTENSAGVSQPPATAPSAEPTRAGTTAASGSRTIKLTLEGGDRRAGVLCRRRRGDSLAGLRVKSALLLKDIVIKIEKGLYPAPRAADTGPFFCERLPRQGEKERLP